MATPPGLDPKAYILTKSIALQENGGKLPDVNNLRGGASGELPSIYQYTPDTWKSVAGKYLGNPNAPVTPENENKATYLRVAEQLKTHTPAQVASMHNAGEGAPNAYLNNVGVNSKGVKYDTPAYVKGVQKYAQQLWNEDSQPSERPAPAQPTPDEIAHEQSGAAFAAKTGDSPLMAGLKTAGNVPSSLLRFLGGAVDSVNPISTIKRLSEIPGVLKDISEQHQTPGQLAGGLAQGAYEAVVPQAARELFKGDIAGAQRTVTNDPIGSIAPLLLGARGGLGAIDRITGAKTAARTADYVANLETATKMGAPIPQGGTNFTSAFDRGVSTVGGTGARIIGAPAKLASNIVGKTADFGIKQATGLGGETRSTITQNPEAFTKASRATVDRTTLADTIKSALDERISSLGESQAAYKPIRSQETMVSVDPRFIDNALEETAGLTVKKGKLRPSSTSSVREARDVTALQTLYDFWKPYFKRGALSPEEFLNFRSDLAKVAKYGRDVGTSKPIENAASVVRGKLNSTYRKQIKGLEKLDAETSSQLTEFKELKKGILDKDNKLTDGAVTRIANATNKGRDAVLGRLEDISPGITQKIRIVKAIEDIEKASENKVGTYGRAALGAGSLLTLNIPGLIATILAQPEVAVPILRQYGFAKPLVTQVIKALKEKTALVNEMPNRLSALPIVSGQVQNTSR